MALLIHENYLISERVLRSLCQDKKWSARDDIVSIVSRFRALVRRPLWVMSL
jgi:hypothetical protein